VSDNMDDLITEMAEIAGNVPKADFDNLSEQQAIAVGLMIVQSLDFLVEAIRDVNRTLNDVRVRL